MIGGDHGNKQVDLSHLFERRRNIIDAAIVRILKRDREVSMDNIASIVSLIFLILLGVKIQITYFIFNVPRLQV